MPAAAATPKRTPRASNATKAAKHQTPATPPTTRGAAATPSKNLAKATPKKDALAEKEFNTPKAKTPAKPANKAPATKSTPVPKGKQTPAAKKTAAVTPKANGKQAASGAKNAKNVETLDNIVADLEKEEEQKNELIQDEAEEVSSDHSDSDSENNTVNQDIYESGSDDDDGSEDDDSSSDNKGDQQVSRKSILKDDSAMEKGAVAKGQQKRVSFANNTEAESAVNAQVTTVPPKDLNDEFALVIKGLNFKCTAADIKKRLTKVHYVRMPVNAAKPTQNNGYCFAYFKNTADVNEAYESLRKNAKILARECFVKFMKPQLTKVANNTNSEKKIDTTTLFIKNWPRSYKSDNVKEVMNVFPDAKCIYVREFKKMHCAIVAFKNTVTASAYLKKPITFQGTKLIIQNYFEPVIVEKRNNAKANTDSQSTAKRQKTAAAPAATSNKNAKPEVTKKEEEPSASEESSSDDAEMQIDDANMAQETDSDDESFSDESSE